MARKANPPQIEPKVFTSTPEVNLAIMQLQRRIKEIEQIDFSAAVMRHTGTDTAAENNLRNTILEIYGPNSPEYRQYGHIRL